MASTAGGEFGERTTLGHRRDALRDGWPTPFWLKNAPLELPRQRSRQDQSHEVKPGILRFASISKKGRYGYQLWPSALKDKSRTIR
jgi:hypothetical protein